MENVLVAGATGTTGQIVVNILKNSQYFRPVAMVRKEDQQDQFKENGVKTVIGDLEEDISDAFKDIDRVIFAAGSKGKKVKAVDQDGAIKMIKAAEHKGIKKFVMLSSMGADNPEVSEDLKDYLIAKKNADDYLRKTILNYTIVRPGSLTNDNAKGEIEIDHKLNKFGKISRADVAKVLTSSLHDNGPKNKAFEILEGETLIAEALESIRD